MTENSENPKLKASKYFYCLVQSQTLFPKTFLECLINVYLILKQPEC